MYDSGVSFLNGKEVYPSATRLPRKKIAPSSNISPSLRSSTMSINTLDGIYSLGISAYGVPLSSSEI
jgi:hypothetical protein